MKIAMIALTAVLGAASTAAVAQTTESTSRQATGERTMTSERSMEEHSMDRHRGGEQISAEEFVKKAGAGGAAEVELSKLASSKATDPEVKAFAQQMVTDHTKTNKELMAAAQAKGIEVPKDPNLLHKGMAEKFKRQSADRDFDHDFMQQMVRDHKANVELFQTAANDTTLDPTFRAVAQKALPTLEQHLEHAQQLEAKLAKE
jgi:putative membrane protein